MAPLLHLRATPIAVTLAILNAIVLTIFIANEQARDAVANHFRQAPIQNDWDWDADVADKHIPFNHTEWIVDDDEDIAEQRKTPLAPSLPAVCDYCGPTDQICEDFGEHNLARSRAYEGSGIRLRRVLAKAQRGEPISIGILGGSVTAGHGVAAGENWVDRFHAFWKKTFPNANHKFVNGAVPAVTSEYYSSCAMEHIDMDVDLIILELSINDDMQEYFMIAYEWLLRRLLKLPNRPAIVNAQILALSFESIGTGGDRHVGLAEYYDIPSISLKNVIAPHIQRNAALEEAYFYKAGDAVDLRHINTRGHRVLADLLISYFRRQLCDLAARQAQYTYLEPSDAMSRWLPNSESFELLPRQRLFTKYNKDETTPDINPTCLSTSSAKNPLKPIQNSGWYNWSWKDKHYLVGKEPGARVSFEVDVSAIGTVSISYQRSKVYGLGNVKCWLEDEPAKARIIKGYWDVEGMNLIKTDWIAGGAKIGKHTAICEIMKETDDPAGGTEFRMVALTSI